MGKNVGRCAFNLFENTDTCVLYLSSKQFEYLFDAIWNADGDPIREVVSDLY